ncbi:hypothetical protein Ate01nite_38560 [Actinoplanes teichomyceticus]|nr:hypothetical protein Ate01nite_38560 [Actinoplanes teichomyceticus]
MRGPATPLPVALTRQDTFGGDRARGPGAADTGHRVIDGRLPAVAIGIYGARKTAPPFAEGCRMVTLLDRAAGPVMAG